MREIKSLKRQGGWAFLAPLIASVVGAIITGQQNKNQAASAQRWSAAQSATAHQREVADLREAGLNPMLSGTGGQGASTTPGIPASVPDALGAGVSSGMQAARLKQELDNMKAGERLTDAQRENTIQSTDESTTREHKTATEKRMLELQIPALENAAKAETEVGAKIRNYERILQGFGLGTSILKDLKK